ncbi:galactokinase [uncultured Cetobacterium sp.]|uniref:galactokinase n=1 Tax=uncultured Cetobacterium sp. TaxID=527638 RepID=UPI00261045A4|nr:galactokinase [uncultured Cetobacterium sp.]
MIDTLVERFKKEFDTNDSVEVFFAPGRVNLIGEHIDYNGGKVFPCALDFGTYAVVKKRKDKTFRMFSENFKSLGIVEFSLSDLCYKLSDDWANYPKGVIKTFLDSNFNIDFGFDILFFGNIPNGAGLSSSASIEVLTAVVLKHLFNLDISMVEMVKLSQKAENEFIGVNCGIMDQFSIGMGKKNHAILLDCNTLDYSYAPFILKDSSIIIANTNKRRGLGDSKYNERRSSCEEALSDLRNNGVKITSLCDMDNTSFEKYKHFIKSEEAQIRAQHAVTENYRVSEAMKSLKNGDLENFGSLMNQSHISLRDNYEVTGWELDSLVQAAWEEDGVIGSRMTGAGFGGCTVSLVKNNCIDNFVQNVGDKYKEKTGLEATFYIGNPGDGARKLGDF